MQWKIIIKWLLLFCYCHLCCAFASEGICLNDIEVNAKANQLAITFLFDDTVKYHCMLLPNPERLVIDLDKVILKTKLPNLSEAFFKGVRSSDHQHEYLRLVFDLQEKVKFNSTFSKDRHALTLNLRREASKPSNSHVEVLPPEPVLTVLNKEKTKKIVVVIDPGHGGKDPGAVGLHGAVEKDVVLKIAKQLQAMLDDEPGFRTILTRTTDLYIPLRQRLAIARKHHADMFIAIHADAYNHSHATGASVYCLSQRGATSEAARWLAEKENESELGGLGEELADKDAVLRSVLIDLSQTHTIEASLQIGNTLLRNLGKFARLHHPCVEQAAFVVLKSPDIPSLLIETGFLSNPLEEEKLTDSAYQHQTAYAIKEGIKQYFILNPPGGTLLSVS
jgi:N-acetylmuramoyl-L-alanine amidase